MSTVIEVCQYVRKSIRPKKHKQPKPIPFPDFFEKVFSEYLTSTSSPHQLSCLSEFESLHSTRGQRRIRLEPRGFAKTLRSQGYVLYCIGYSLESFILWLSNTESQAVDSLGMIRQIIENNDAFKELCPQAAGKGQVWRKHRIITRNGIRVDACGALQNIRGRRKGKSRPSLIIGDDLQKTEQMESAALRRRTNNWFARDVMYVGSPETNYFVTDTAIHYEAISYVLATKTPGWDAQIHGAIIGWPTRMDLWNKWKDILLDHSREQAESEAEAKIFYDQNYDDMNHGAESLWPQRFPLYDLMKRWAESGQAAFNSEYQNSPHDPSLSLWSADCFDHPNLWYDELPENIAIRTTGVDASLGKHDYAAIVEAACDINGVWWIDADLEVDDPRSMCARLVDRSRLFTPDGIHLEALQFQTLIKPDLEAEFQKKQLRFEVFADEDTTKKEVRIRRLSTYITQRRIRLKRRSKGAILLLEQLRGFPTSEFDDAPDALEKAVRLAGMLL